MEKEKNEEKITKKHYGIKIILVGDTNVGKTQIIRRYVDKTFDDIYVSTIGYDLKPVNIELEDKIFKLSIYDTVGQEKFRSIIRGYFKNSACAIIVFDITNEQSFESVKQWFEECKSLGSKDIHMVLVGNKIDLEDKRKVSEEEGNKLADELGINYFETSAKAGKNIETIFNEIYEFINKSIDEGKYDLNNPSHGVTLIEREESLVINKHLNKEEYITSKNKNKKCC